MAFESFLTQEKGKPKNWRRLTYTLSLALHGTLLVAGAVYSFWNVDELSPPSVSVTFLASTPPPPPPPPPPKKKKTTVIKRPTEVVQPRPNEIVQPKEAPPPEEEEEDDGVEGGVEGGVPGGVVGGLGTATDAPKMVPPNIGSGQLAINVQQDPYKPRLPPALNRAGNSVWGMFKICVTAAGTVQDVKVIKSADPLADNEWMGKIKTWTYKPYSINGRPVPFCYPLRLTVTASL